MPKTAHFMRYVIKPLVFLGCLGLLALGGVTLYLYPKLPSVESLKDVQLQVPLRIYTADHKLIAEYGEMKRTPLTYKQTPELMIKALLAAEDDRFFEHPGVDYQGILRAVIHLIRTGKKGQGGSTITMQVARNFFLSREKTYLRKFNEILLALKIESEISKEEILELYVNKIYLGHRAYGIAAAAQIYYGTDIAQLELHQIAMIAGLPKAPSRYNPLADSKRAVIRRDYVLNRMHSLAYIGDQALETALMAPDNARHHGLTIEVSAPYVAEMVRKNVVEKYGNAAYTRGYNIITTINSRLQMAANDALQKNIFEYDTRHGYRGKEGHINLDNFPTTQSKLDILKRKTTVASLIPAIVIAVEDQSIQVLEAKGGVLTVPWSGLSWARRYLDDNHRKGRPKSASEIVKTGDIVRVKKNTKNDLWQLAQLPKVEGALVSINPHNGRIISLVGGFNFYRSKFNRVTQATRQPGSSFKPFIYSAALEKGYTAASVINDAPVVFDDPGLESEWRPENYSGKFYGPTRLREALVKSRNLVSIRLLRAINVKKTIQYAEKFGFNPDTLPNDLSLSLGSGSITPLELASAYAVFANGGYRVSTHFIDKILDAKENIVFQAQPDTVCDPCPTNPVDEEQSALPPPAQRVITPQNAYLITSMMQEVIKRGTGRRARSLNRKDIAGKTGTTNDQRDAWFTGYNQDAVTIAWMGFDSSKPLGKGETGSRAALPMWISYMREALKNTKDQPLRRPKGLITVRIDRETGHLSHSGDPKAIFETFRKGNMPTQRKKRRKAPQKDVKQPRNIDIQTELF